MTSLSDIRAKHFPNGPMPAPRRPKYNNRKTVLDGMVFDSAAESRDWAELSLRQKAGEIRNLRRQVTFKCEWNGILVCKYIADFAFDEYQAALWRIQRDGGLIMTMHSPDKSPYSTKTGRIIDLRVAKALIESGELIADGGGFDFGPPQAWAVTHPKEMV